MKSKRFTEQQIIELLKQEGRRAGQGAMPQARLLVLCPRNDLYYVRSTAMLKHAEKSSPCEFDAP